MAAYIIVGIVAYLIGSISFSVIISKKMAGFDVREKGSGNAGATNMLRSVGKKAAALPFDHPAGQEIHRREFPRQAQGY